MAWNDVASNQTVSFANLKNAVDTDIFISKTTQSTSNEQITKADANTYAYIDTSYAPYASKSSNQLVVKSDLRGGFTVYGSNYGCVIPETQILIAPDISRRADSLSIGDKVYTQHEDDKRWDYFKIVNLESKIQPLLKIETSQGEITCSTTHLLFRNGEYVEAKELVVGDYILHLSCEALVNEITPLGDGEVIEFTIEDAHTYVAGGFFSHNKCSTGSWADCGQACSNGVTSYSSNIAYTGALQLGTLVSSTGACSITNGFYYYLSNYIEFTFNGSSFEVTSLGTCSSCSAEIFIDNNNSLDIPITDMTVNGVSVSYLSGANFTINAGNNGNFYTDQLGTYTVIIYYGGHIPGQNIVFTDSNGTITCKDLNGSAGSFTIANAVITGGTTIYVTASDGACI